MSEPFDLDALAEEGQPFAFKFDGKNYEFPADISIEIVGLLQTGQILPAVQELLGEDQWQSISDSPKVLGVSGLKALMDAYAKHLGVESLGGSPASIAS